MNFSKSTLICLAFLPLLLSQSYADGDNLRRGMRIKVNQVYLQQKGGESHPGKYDNDVPLDSFPIVKSDFHDQRRNLSVWTSILNFIKCPPGFHHDENPHCHHHHDNSHHSSHSSGESTSGNTSGGSSSGSSSEGGGENGGCGDSSSAQCGENQVDDNTNDQDDVDDNTGCSDDGCRDGNFDDAFASTPSPTVFEDNISNDQSCWWCGRGQRNGETGGGDGTGTYSFYHGNSSLSSSTYAYGAVAVAGTAAVLAVFFRKRYTTSTAPPLADDHLLSGAVGKRNVTFSNVLNVASSPSRNSEKNLTARRDDRKRKSLFSRLFHGRKQARNKVGLAPEEGLGNHYVKV